MYLMYLLSKLLPVPMRTTYVASVDGHSDLVSARWWQWRGRCVRQRTVSARIGV
jgi:hypothetical protein